MRKSYLLLAVGLLLSGSLLASAGTSKAKDIAQEVDRKYNSIQSLQMDFIEKYKGAGIQRNESGTLTLKKPGRMRWDYRRPTEKIFLSDGKTAYFYVPGERQARKAPVKKIDDLRSPLRYLLGKAKLADEFSDLQLAEGVSPLHSGNVILSGIPKHLADRVERVLLEITPEHMIERIIIEEVDGSNTEFQFSNFSEDRVLSDSTFRFSAPSGVEMIEAKELTGE